MFHEFAAFFIFGLMYLLYFCGVVRQKLIEHNIFRGSNHSRKLRLEKYLKNHIFSLDLDKTERGS